MGSHSFNNNKNKIYIVLIVILIILAIAVFAFVKNKNKSSENSTNISTLDTSSDENNAIDEKKSIDQIISDFGGEITEKVSDDMYYILKDNNEYTVYSDGDILSGKVTAWNGEESKPAIDEAGNINIYTAEELKWVANQVISGTKNFAGVTITLRKGIDLSGRYDSNNKTWSGNEWTPIVGTIANDSAQTDASETNYDDSVKVKEENLKRFAGTFDGNNQIIKGLYINQEKDYQGLFGYTTGTIINLTISSSYVKGNDSNGAIVGLNGGSVSNSKIIKTEVTGNSKIGGLIGIAMPQSKAENIIAEGNENNIHGNEYVGGLIGYTNNNAILEACKNESTVSGKNYIGGITGIAFYGTTIANSYNRNNSITGEQYVGGLVGYSEAQIEFCYNQEINSDKTSKITGNKYVGGIVGTNYNTGLINSCYNNGEIIIKEDIAGGIVGVNNATVQNTYNNGKISASGVSGKKIGGICGQNSTDCMIINSYNVGEILNPICDGIIGDNFGNIDKCYYLDSAVKNKTNDGESKTSDEIKNLVDTLGENFIKDESTINNGYPILNWQVQK